VDKGLELDNKGIQLISRFYDEGVEVNTVYGTSKMCPRNWDGQTTVFVELPNERYSYTVQMHYNLRDARAFHRRLEDFVELHTTKYILRALESEAYKLLFEQLKGV
jgi:hypothetical protein